MVFAREGPAHGWGAGRAEGEISRCALRPRATTTAGSIIYARIRMTLSHAAARFANTSRKNADVRTLMVWRAGAWPRSRESRRSMRGGTARAFGPTIR